VAVTLTGFAEADEDIVLQVGQTADLDFVAPRRGTLKRKLEVRSDRGTSRTNADGGQLSDHR